MSNCHKCNGTPVLLAKLSDVGFPYHMRVECSDCGKEYVERQTMYRSDTEDVLTQQLQLAAELVQSWKDRQAMKRANMAYQHVKCPHCKGEFSLSGGGIKFADKISVCEICGNNL